MNSFRLVRRVETRSDAVVGGRGPMYTGRGALDLDCSGNGWTVSASLAAFPGQPADTERFANVFREVLALIEQSETPPVGGEIG